jgi:secreted trypsin-like serine protease
MCEARVPIVGDKECGTAHDRFVAKLLVCAGKPGVSTCLGDGGGPLFRVREGSSLPQNGIVSFATGYAAKHFPTAYTEVSALIIAKSIQQAIGGTVALAEPAAA